jgi:membrane-associated protein
MATHTALAAGWLDTGSMLSRFGAWAVLVVIFAETGLPVVGIFLPADALLLPAGLLCSPHAPSGVHLSLPLILLCAGLGSVAGAQAGFWLGRRGGRIALTRGSAGRGRNRIERAEMLFTRYGQRRALLLGRFVPVVRTLVHPAAGLLGMPTASFTLWQAAAGLAWSQSLVLAGYLLGSSGANGSSYTVAAIAAAVALGLVPPAWHYWRARRAARRIRQQAAGTAVVGRSTSCDSVGDRLRPPGPRPAHTSAVKTAVGGGSPAGHAVAPHGCRAPEATCEPSLPGPGR